MLTLKDVHEALYLTGPFGLLPNSFIGGSYVVKGLEAADIDIVVPLFDCDVTKLEAAGFEQYRFESEDPKYAEALNDPLNRLVFTFRRGNLNLIVINNDYLPAYRGAVAAMAADPDRYAERDDRVRLHVQACTLLKQLATGELLN
jgi:hypothetical protein